MPASLRTVVEANNPRQPSGDVLRTLSIAPHETEKCLIAYDQAYPQHLQDQLSARSAMVTEPGAAPDWNVKRVSMGIVDVVPFDASGRFVLQGYPRQYAGIDDAALFIAVGDVIEIWSPAELEASKTADPRVKELARFLSAAKDDAA